MIKIPIDVIAISDVNLNLKCCNNNCKLNEMLQKLIN